MNGSSLPSLYNPGVQRDDDKFIAEFVARHDLLETLLRRLRTHGSDTLGLHHILIGPRGMGKTSLLRRIAIAIRREPDLSTEFIPLNFREEQYNVLTLGDFWRNCGESLAEWAEAAGQTDLAQRLDEALPTEAWATDETAAEQFRVEIRALGRRAVLLVDNLDLILDALPDESAWALRRRLQARRGPILIGASTHPLKQSANRDAAFYEFFHPVHLEPLDAKETERCMRALAVNGGEHGDRVVRILDAEPARLRTLHALTAGNPRVLALIYRLLGTGESEAAMADLERLLDQVTPYYKAKIEEYQTAQQRAVIDAIALNWDPVTTGDLADLTRIPSTTLSPLLIRLRKDGLIESVELSGSYAGHQLAERFLNIWYLMRHGTRRTKQKMRWLVAFLTSFYSLTDLTEIAGRSADRASWRPEYRLAFDEALERQSLRVQSEEMSGLDITNLELSRSSQIKLFYGAIDVLSDAGEYSQKMNDSSIDQAANADNLDGSTPYQTAEALIDEAEDLVLAGDSAAAIAVCDTVVARLASASETVLREHVARALVIKTIAIFATDDNAAAIVNCDQVLLRFADASDPGLREQVAWALVIKAVALNQMGDSAAAIVVCNDVLARFGDAPEPSLREQIARALVNKAVALSQTGDTTAQLATCDEVLARFADCPEPSLRQQVARVLVSKAITLGQMGEMAAAIAVCDDVFARFADAPESELREEVAWALANKAVALHHIGDSAAAITACDEVLVRFSGAPEYSIREAVAKALLNKAIALDQMGDSTAAIAVYDEVFAHFAAAPEPGLHVYIAKALVNKAVTLGDMGESKAAIAVCEEVLARFDNVPDSALREGVARALDYKAFALSKIGDSAAAIATYDDILARFAAANEPTMLERVAIAIRLKAVTLLDQGQAAAAIKTFECFFERTSGTSQNFTAVDLDDARIIFANMLLDFQEDLLRAEELYREAATTKPLLAKENLAWLYLMADRSSDARREVDELSHLPAVALALLNAGIELASDNFGATTIHLSAALDSDLDTSGMSFRDDLERLLRLAQHKGYGERLLAWFEQTGYADRLTPLYVAFKAYVRTEKLLLDVNPEVRGPAQIIYDRLDAPRRYAAARTPQKPKPRRPRSAARRGKS